MKQSQIITFIEKNGIKKKWLSDKIGILPPQLRKYVNNRKFKKKYQDQSLEALRGLADDIYKFTDKVKKDS